MNPTILLADDSLTIQKVVKITLAGAPYEISICDNESDFDNTIKNSKFDLIILDYDFAADIDGLEFAEKIKALSPSSKILMLYGTFDTIDEARLKEMGIADRIVKPFDSTKFVNTCQEILKDVIDDAVEEEEIEVEDISIDMSDIREEDIEEAVDEWKMNAPEIDEETLDDKVSTEEELSVDLLADELTGWGIEVPGVIGEKEDNFVDLPPKMEDETRPGFSPQISIGEQDLSSGENEDTHFPSSDDLAFPEVEMVENEEKLAASTKFISLDELAPEEKEQDKEDVDKSFDETGSYRIEREILADEKEEDFWAVDAEKELEDIKIDEVNSSPQPKFNQEDFAQELKEKMTPVMETLIEKLVEKYCKDTMERVAWEIMPDLAENLIKEELSKISNDVLEKS